MAASAVSWQSCRGRMADATVSGGRHGVVAREQPALPAARRLVLVPGPWSPGLVPWRGWSLGGAPDVGAAHPAEGPDARDQTPGTGELLLTRPRTARAVTRAGRAPA